MQNTDKARDQHSGEELDNRDEDKDQLQRRLNSQNTRSESPPHPTIHHKFLARNLSLQTHRHSARSTSTSRRPTLPVSPASHTRTAQRRLVRADITAWCLTPPLTEAKVFAASRASWWRAAPSAVRDVPTRTVNWQRLTETPRHTGS